LIDVAVAAVHASGRIQRRRLYTDKKIEHKGEINLVTEVDRLCERKIVDVIRHHFPDHDILTEETPMPEQGSPYRWIVDPLDGTTNYAHGYPFFATSIAVEYEGTVILGVAYDPLRRELFTTHRGGGAFLNGERIAVSRTPRLNEALLCTGFPYDLRESPDNNVDHFNRIIMAATAVRRDGAAVLDLCYVAMGRFDGFWELKLYPWDVAAGVLMVREAGGRVTDFQGREENLDGRTVVATNGLIHAPLMTFLQADH